MSYILDALRRADAERERDPARGIHAQPLAPEAARRHSALPAWASGGLVVLAAIGAAYAWWPRPPQAVAVNPVARPAAAVLPVAVAVAPEAAAAPMATVAPGAAGALIAPVAPVPAHANTLRPAARSVHPAALVTAPALLAPASAGSSPAAGRPSNAAPTSAMTATAAPAGALPATTTAAQAAAAGTAAAPSVAATAAPPAAAVTPAGRIYAVSELPPDVQRELPKLAISGGVYSDSAAQRMLIVGGQVMFEGNELAPGLVLEQIRDRSAVLRFRGYRYSVGY